jgi:hypothetical protein
MIETGRDPSPPNPEKTIFLAETTSDLKHNRKNIQRELEKEGLTIFPDPSFQADKEFREQVQSFISRCKLSIHLVGSKYGSIPEEEEKSIVEIQNELAAEQAQRNKLMRLIWIDPDLKVTGERHERFIENLEKVAAGEPGARLIKNSFEDFKTIIKDTLSKLSEPALQEYTGAGGPTHIYLMHDETDRGCVQPIEDFLFDKGFEVKMPLFEGSPSELREFHQDHLFLCDAMMIYYGDTSHVWLENKMNDILKARGFNRTKPISASAVYITGEKTQYKERFRTHDALVIKHFEPFQAEVLEPFVDQLRRGIGGA